MQEVPEDWSADLDLFHNFGLDLATSLLFLGACLGTRLIVKPHDSIIWLCMITDNGRISQQQHWDYQIIPTVTLEH